VPARVDQDPVEALAPEAASVDPPERNGALVDEQHEIVEPKRVSQLAVEVLECEVDTKAVAVLAEQAALLRRYRRLSLA
jgi:hypothetical protein